MGYQTFSRNSVCSSASRSMRILFVFDFDDTIVQANTDIKILEAFPDFNTAPYKKIYKEDGWTAYMNKIFEAFKENDLHKEDFEKVLRTIELTDGMRELFDFISKHPRIFECIIASDSNSWFIEYLLKHHKIADMFKDVFTHQGRWECGTLVVEPYTSKHECSKCPVNMCKAEIVNYERVCFRQVVYIGDGNNDVCPVLSLRGGDLACPRKGFKLARMIKMKQNAMEADLAYWTNAADLIPALDKMLEELC